MGSMLQVQVCFCVLAINLLLTPSAAVPAVTTAVDPTDNQQQRLCSNLVATDACRGFIGSRKPTEHISCHDQLLSIICSIRSLSCPSSQQPLTSSTSTMLENPVCQKSCLRVFKHCPPRQLIYSYMPITVHLCAGLPNQLCHEWPNKKPHRGNRTTAETLDIGNEMNICQSSEASDSCGRVVYIGDDVGKRVQRRGGGVGGGGLTKLRHPFKKSDFKKGNYTYAAVVNLVKVEWRSADGPPQQSLPHRRGFERVLHLEIMEVLYIHGGRSRGSGFIQEPGSVQIVRLQAGCDCLPVKLDQSLIFVGFNSYLKNVHLTDGDRVALLPNNPHYKCKIKRCWHKRKQSVRDPEEFGDSPVVTTGSEGWGVSRRPDCLCPCGKWERRRCKKRRRSQGKRRRGTGGGGRGAGRRRSGGGGSLPDSVEFK